MPKRSSTKRRRSVNQVASAVVEMNTDGSLRSTAKNPAAVALGRLGGLKGGRARAEKLSAKKRKAIAQKAAQARWGVNIPD